MQMKKRNIRNNNRKYDLSNKHDQIYCTNVQECRQKENIISSATMLYLTALNHIRVLNEKATEYIVTQV